MDMYEDIVTIRIGPSWSAQRLSSMLYRCSLQLKLPGIMQRRRNHLAVIAGPLKHVNFLFEGRLQLMNLLKKQQKNNKKKKKLQHTTPLANTLTSFRI